MYGFIFGFQRRVWCPKCTPASKSCFMETALMDAFPFLVASSVRRRTRHPGGHPVYSRGCTRRSERTCVIQRDDTGTTLRLENRRLGQAVAERHDRLGVDLAHPGLGHTQNLADLRQGEALVVVEGDDEALAVRQSIDRIDEHPARLFCLEGRLRGDARRVGH